MIQGIVKGANKKGVSWLYFLIYVVIIIVVIVIVVKVYKSLKQGVNSVGNLAADATTSATTGIPVGRLQQIRSIAENLYKNRFQYGNVPWDDWDEAAFISAINQMQSVQELQILCSNYAELGDKTIAYVIKDSFSNKDIQQLKAGFYSAAISF